MVDSRLYPRVRQLVAEDVLEGFVGLDKLGEIDRDLWPEGGAPEVVVVAEEGAGLGGDGGAGRADRASCLQHGAHE